MLVTAASLLGAAPALATIHPQLISPGKGHKVKVRHRPLFVVRDTAKKKSYNDLFLSVAHSKRRNKCGALKDTSNGVFAQMHRRRGTKYTFTYRAKFYDYPKFWLNRPGKYFWQVYRIDSGGKCLEVKSGTRVIRVVR